jgi:plastocyanin
MKILPITLVAASFALAAGCTDTNRADSDPAVGNASIDIEGASREALVGDTVTFVARSHDTYGRDAKVTWSSTGGDVSTDEDGRVARVRFTEPGTYSVRASLEIEGRAVQNDIVEVRVKPLN